VSVTKPSNAVNAGMANRLRDVDLRFPTSLHPQLFGWFVLSANIMGFDKEFILRGR
jgi:hypothetical protein